MINLKKGLRDTVDLVPPIKFNGKVYFKTSELGCRCSFCRGKGKLAPGFAELLLALRLEWKRPMSVSSCCRCIEHNRISKGTDGSYHIYETEVGTCAIDVRMQDSVLRADFVEFLLQRGCRVGITDSFIHLDFAPLFYPETEERKLFLY